MAQIPILDHAQITDRPRWYRKKSIVKKLIARGLAFWVVEQRLARMIAPEEIKAMLLSAKVLSTPWEPIEIPGLHFEEPLIRHNPDAAIVRRFKAVMA